MKKYKTPLLVVGLVIVVISLVGFTYGLTSGKEGEIQPDHVLSMNDIGVSAEEFMLFLQDEKAATATYFYQKYGAEDSEDFWNKSYEGEIPIEFAKETAIEKLVNLKVEQELAVAYGLLESPLFEDIERELENEDSMYGAESLNEYQQYMLYHSKILIDTLTQFKNDSSGLPEKDLEAYYEDHQFTMFKEADEVKAIQIGMVFTNNEPKDSVVAEITAQLQNDSSIHELEEKYNITIQEKEYGPKEGKDENASQLEMLLSSEAHTLGVGEVSDPVQYGEQYFIMMVTEKNEGKVKSFEEVKENIQNLLIEEAFNKMIEDNVRNAQIIFNEQKLRDIQMQ